MVTFGLCVCDAVASQPTCVQLVRVHLKATVLDANVGVRVVQEYHNPTDHAVNVTYTFSLDCKAGVHEFCATIDDLKVKGMVKEKDAAQKEFDTAKTEGKTAALLKQSNRDKDTFECEIGNLPAHKSCIIELLYVAQLRICGNDLEMHLPTWLAPRYTPTTIIWVARKFFRKQLKKKETLMMQTQYWKLNVLVVVASPIVKIHSRVIRLPLL